jgi:ubiquitin carboxyl-terminal hydrolase L3
MVESNSDPNGLPLESNPEIINDYVEEIGFETSKFLYYDMLGVEEWAQDMIPKPVLAVMFLYPIKEETEELDEAEKQRILKDGQKISSKVI